MSMQPLREAATIQRTLEQIKRVQIAHHNEVEVPDYPRIEKVVKYLSQKSPGMLLDIGYSKGSFPDYLVSKGWICTGLDINKHESSTIRTIECDLNMGFPLEPESFDAITAGEIIEHMIDEGDFLDECHRVLKRGGTLALTTPNLAFSINRLLVMIGKTPMFVYAPYHYHFHTKRTILDLLLKHKFSIKRVISSHVLYSRRKHSTGWVFERLGDVFPTLGAHLIVFAAKE